jgi:hypothetical protein
MVIHYMVSAAVKEKTSWQLKHDLSQKVTVIASEDGR